MARFIADQRTFFLVPYTSCCAILGASVSWLHKWRAGDAVAMARWTRRCASRSMCSGASPARRVSTVTLVEAGWSLSVNTVADASPEPAEPPAALPPPTDFEKGAAVQPASGTT
ncbi:hypothetical protein [Kribbella speibonae]|uniref:Uncharacterized protein n=1 Tax=Kribbella speibonae TaxID=1572660 RepID=A0A4R0IXZ8_9ACTN|nr:hypothetical protein [Kribbella speibonae]TCC36468.1 hypothetical protein E0H92_27960 [Kribbella speibonae]